MPATSPNMPFSVMPKIRLHSGLLFRSLALILLLSLAGCSGDRAKADGQAAINACSLITQAEMTEITGRTMKLPVEKVTGGGTTCTYVSSDETGKDGVAPMISFALLVSSSENTDADAAYTYYVASMKKTLNMDMTEIQGIGQRACWNEGVGQLTAFSGRHMLLLSAGTKEQGKLDTCRKIIVKALPRLPE